MGILGKFGTEFAAGGGVSSPRPEKIKGVGLGSGDCDPLSPEVGMGVGVEVNVGFPAKGLRGLIDK